MSQIDINTRQQVNLNANGPQAQGTGPRADLPQELQNARPSTSVWAKIGRVASYIARGIFAVGTLGLSEAAIWGVKKLYNYCHASPQPPQPRMLSQQDISLLPNAAPRADVNNRTLYNGMVRLDLPQEYKDALGELLQELSGSFGKLVPKNLEELRTLFIANGRGGNDAFVAKLRRKVESSTEAVTPGRLKEMARQVLLPDLTSKSIADALKTVAADLGMTASKEALHMAACEMFDKTGGVLFQNQAQATAFVAAHRDIAAPTLKKTALLDGLDKKQLPPAYKAQLDSVANELRLAFGAKCLPGEQADILGVRPSLGNSLCDTLRKAAESGPLSPQDFGKLVRDSLKPFAQRFAVGQAIGRAMEKQGVKPNPGILPKLVQGLIKSGGQGMNAAVNGLANVAGTQNILAQPAAQQFLTEIVADMKAMEEEYLPRVSDDAKPLLRNLIRSLPFDAANRGSSVSMVQHMAQEMAGWKADIPMGAEATQKFCDKMVAELNIRTSTLAAEQPNKFNGNIFSSFTADANRNMWTFNGKVLNYMPPEHLEGELTRNVPTAIDQQFLSKLTNQYAWTNLSSPLQGTWNMTGDNSANEINGSGLAKATPLLNGFMQQPQNFDGMKDIAGETSFTITVAPDKKTAVVEIVRPYVICTDEPKGQPVGTANLVMRVECKLSGGDPNVKPEVTKVQVSQKLTPLTF